MKKMTLIFNVVSLRCLGAFTWRRGEPTVWISLELGSSGISTWQDSDSNLEYTWGKYSHNFGLKALLVLGVDIMGQKSHEAKGPVSLSIWCYDLRQLQIFKPALPTPPPALDTELLSTTGDPFGGGVGWSWFIFVAIDLNLPCSSPTIILILFLSSFNLLIFMIATSNPVSGPYIWYLSFFSLACKS